MLRGLRIVRQIGYKTGLKICVIQDVTQLIRNILTVRAPSQEKQKQNCDESSTRDEIFQSNKLVEIK